MKLYLYISILGIATALNPSYGGKKFITHNPIIKAILATQRQTNQASLNNGFSPKRSIYRINGKYSIIKPIHWAVVANSYVNDFWLGESYCSGIHAWMIYWPHSTIGRFKLDQIGIINSNFAESNFETLRNSFSSCWQKNSSKFYMNGQIAPGDTHKSKKVFKSGNKHILLIDMDNKEISLHSNNGKSTPTYKIPYDEIRPALRLEVSTSHAKIQYLGAPEEMPPRLKQLCIDKVLTTKKVKKHLNSLPKAIQMDLFPSNQYLHRKIALLMPPTVSFLL